LRITYSVIWFILTLFLFNSCQNKSDSQVVTFWAMGSEGEYTKALISDFEALNPKIKIDVQTIPWSAAHEKLLTAYAGDALPDIFQLGNTWIPEFQAVGAIAFLDSLIENSEIVKEDYFFRGIWETNLIDDKIFGIPWYVDTRVLFYRSDILTRAGISQPPNTWEEWWSISQKIKQLDPENYAVFFPLNHSDWQVPVILIMQNQGKILKENNRFAAFDDPNTIEALKFYLQFFREDLAPKNMSAIANIYHGFGSGFFAMFITGPWNVNELNRRLKDHSIEWKIAPLPGKKNRLSVAGGSSLVISKSSKKIKAAWKFIEFLSLPKTQFKFYQESKDLPAVISAWDLGNFRDDPRIVAFYQQLQEVQATPKIPEWEQIATKLQEHLETVIFRRITLEQAIEKLNKDVNQILEKRRWLMAKKRGQE